MHRKNYKHTNYQNLITSFLEDDLLQLMRDYVYLDLKHSNIWKRIHLHLLPVKIKQNVDYFT